MWLGRRIFLQIQKKEQKQKHKLWFAQRNDCTFELFLSNSYFTDKLPLGIHINFGQEMHW